MKTISSRSITLSSEEVTFLENELSKQVNHHQIRLRSSIKNHDFDKALILSTRLDLMTSLWLKLLDI